MHVVIRLKFLLLVIGFWIVNAGILLCQTPDTSRYIYENIWRNTTGFFGFELPVGGQPGHTSIYKGNIIARQPLCNLGIYDGHYTVKGPFIHFHLADTLGVGSFEFGSKVSYLTSDTLILANMSLTDAKTISVDTLIRESPLEFFSSQANNDTARAIGITDYLWHSDRFPKDSIAHIINVSNANIFRIKDDCGLFSTNNSVDIFKDSIGKLHLLKQSKQLRDPQPYPFWPYEKTKSYSGLPVNCALMDLKVFNHLVGHFPNFSLSEVSMLFLKLVKPNSDYKIIDSRHEYLEIIDSIRRKPRGFVRISNPDKVRYFANYDSSYNDFVLEEANDKVQVYRIFLQLNYRQIELLELRFKQEELAEVKIKLILPLDRSNTSTTVNFITNN